MRESFATKSIWHRELLNSQKKLHQPHQQLQKNLSDRLFLLVLPENEKP